MNSLKSFLADTNGTVSIEFTVIASSIVLATAAVIGQIGGELRTPLGELGPEAASR